MSDCCHPAADSGSNSRKQACPSCSTECLQVSERTVLHHIKWAWTWKPSARTHFFCHNTACDIVYFGLDGDVIKKDALKTTVGIKDPKPDSLLCYCFHVTRANVESHPEIRNFLIEQTRAGNCSCDTANPSGRCCLKDFPK